VRNGPVIAPIRRRKFALIAHPAKRPFRLTLDGIEEPAANQDHFVFVNVVQVTSKVVSFHNVLSCCDCWSVLTAADSKIIPRASQRV